MQNIKCPYCISERIGDIDNDSIVQWKCGTNLDIRDGIPVTIEPTDECNALMKERLKIKLTDVGQYVAGLKEIEDLFPDAVPESFQHKRIDKPEEAIDPKRKAIMDLLEKISKENNN
jgi:hypothetical protein